MGNHYDPNDDKPYTPPRAAPPTERMKQHLQISCLHSQEDLRLFAEAWLAYELFRHDPLLTLDSRLLRVNSELIPRIRARLPFECELYVRDTSVDLATRSLTALISVVANHTCTNNYRLTLNTRTGEATIIPRY